MTNNIIDGLSAAEWREFCLFAVCFHDDFDLDGEGFTEPFKRHLVLMGPERLHIFFTALQKIINVSSNDNEFRRHLYAGGATILPEQEVLIETARNCLGLR